MSDYDDIINSALADAEEIEKNAGLNLDDDALGNISELSKEMMRLEDVVASLEDAKKKASELLRGIREERLPEAMMQAELKSIELDNGGKLSVSKKYIGSIKKEAEKAALAWFVETQRAGVITPKISIPVDKGHLEDAEEYVKKISELGIYAELTPSVHWQTLRAVVRELYESGEEPPECISTFVINEAKIKRK